MSNEELSTFAAPRSPALGLRLKPSRRLAAALAAAHLACAGLLWPLALAFWLKLALAGGLGASLIWRLRRDAFLVARSSILSLIVREDCSCTMGRLDGEWEQGILLGSSFVSPGLVILNIRSDARMRLRHVVLSSDSLDREDFRRLRVLLKCKCAGKGLSRP